MPRVVAIAVLAALCLSGSARDVSRTNADAVLITSYMWDPTPAAVLVTDRKAIEELAGLLVDNPFVPHACGYHWLVNFRKPDGSVTQYPHNDKCQCYERNSKRVHDVIRRYTTQIRKRPSHFVFDVEVPVTLAPEEIVSRMAGAPEMVFFLDGTDQRLPRLEIEAVAKSSRPEDRAKWDAARAANTAAATRKLEEAVAAIRRIAPGIHHSKFQFRTGQYGPGIIQDHYRTTIYFPLGTSIPKAPAGVEEIKRMTPSRYTIQVAATERSAAVMKPKLEARLRVAVDVASRPR